MTAELSSLSLPEETVQRHGRFMTTLAALLLKRRPLPFRIALGVTLFAIATVLRHLAEGILPQGFPFVTFFPAVLLATVFSGARIGIAVAIASGLTAWYLFIPPFRSLALTGGSVVAMLFYIGIVATEILFIAATHVALRMLDTSQRRAAELAKSRELMFSELQHRVSNNLSTVAALLRMQASKSPDDSVRKALTEGQLRISTVARLQRRLHAPDAQEIDVPDFLKTLADDTMDVAGTGGNVVLTFDMDPLSLDRDRAIPLGLIASELLMNAVEHGRSDGGAVKIAVTLRTAGRDAEGLLPVTLDIQDNGAGLSDGFSLTDTKSLGLSIAREFARQLDGELFLTDAPDGGTLARLTFHTGQP